MKTNKRCYIAPNVLQEAEVLLEYPFVASSEGLDPSLTVIAVDQDVMEYETDGTAYDSNWSW